MEVLDKIMARPKYTFVTEQWKDLPRLRPRTAGMLHRNSKIREIMFLHWSKAMLWKKMARLI